MNVIAINGSPRKQGNSAALLESAIRGAEAAGAVCERIDLFDLNYKGCVSCFGCKLLGGPSFGRCAQQDELKPVLDKILAADVLLLATPLYFGEVPGAVRNLLERLWFPAQLYRKDFRSAYTRRIKIGLMYTMNWTSDDMYKDLIMGQVQNFRFLMGNAEYMTAVDTMQFDDYSKYSSEMFDGAAKRARHETEFPKDCERAFALGKKLASK